MQQRCPEETLLLFASEFGYDKVIQSLVAGDRRIWSPLRIDVNDIYRSTPLHLASKGGHLSVVKLLLEAGANANLIDHSGSTALQLA